MKTRNSEVLADFIAYCILHPDDRFWQALRNWAGVNFIFFVNHVDWDKSNITMRELNALDTYYYEGKNHEIV